MIPNPVRSIYCHTKLALCLSLWATASMALAGTCTVSSSGLEFGAYQPLTLAGKLSSINVTSTATITVTCTDIVTGGSYIISLGASNFGTGNRISPRYLNNTSNGGSLMEFNVFTDAGNTSIWGDGSIGVLLNGMLASGNNNLIHTVYGNIPSGQYSLKPGSFSDSLTMTLTYSP